MFKFLQSKKGQGTVSALVFGIATLVVAVIIAFIVVSTLSGADLLKEGRSSNTVNNETGAINATGYTLDLYGETASVDSSFAIVRFLNLTDNSSISSGNYTVSSGIVTNASSVVWSSVSITYTYNNYTTDELSSERMIANMTAGVDNVSAKIPTVLLVAAIVLIMSLLVLLVGAWQKMKVGGNSI